MTRIAGSNGEPVFDSDATVAIFRYSLGIPRVINLLCEHCLVSGFVDQKKVIPAEVVDSVHWPNPLEAGFPRPPYPKKEMIFGGHPQTPELPLAW